MAARRVAFINEKGGTCKTTLTVNCGAYLALEHGQRVLLVDMDPQAHTGKCLGVPVRELNTTLYDLLRDPLSDIGDARVETRIPGLDLLAANKSLAEFTEHVAGELEAHQRLRAVLDRLEDDYDYICVDSPPSLGMPTINIMLAVSDIVVPVSLTYLAMDGCAEMVESVENVRERFGHPDLKITHIVPTLYRKTNLADAILGKLRGHFGSCVSQTVIGYNVRIDEAQSHGQTIWEYDPRSTGAQALARLTNEIFGYD